MRSTLLFSTLLVLASTSLAASENRRFLAGCNTGCISCSAIGVCKVCADGLVLSLGSCIEPYTFKNLIYVQNDHYSWTNIDNGGVDIPVCVIGGVCAAVVYFVLGFLIYKQDWQQWVPETKEAAKPIENATPEAKEHAKNATPGDDKVIEMGTTDFGHTASTKAPVLASPEKRSNATTQRSKSKYEDEEERDLEQSPNAQMDEIDEDEEEPYYPNQKDIETRKKRAAEGHDEEENQEEEEQEEVEVQVHDGGEDSDARTAQETPSPKTDIRTSQRASSVKKSHKRNDSHHSDAEEEVIPQRHSRPTHERGEEASEEEEFASARSKQGSQEVDGQEEEEQEEEQEEEDEDEDEAQDIMDLNDLGVDANKK